MFCIEIHWRTTLCKEGPERGQLEKEPDSQRALTARKQVGLPPMVNIKWIVTG